MIFQEQGQHQETFKKLLPRGTCLPSDVKKFQHVKKLINEPLAHIYILPISPSFSPFVVVRTSSGTSKDIFKMYYHPTKTFLLSAQDQGMTIGCNYLISRSNIPSKDANFVAKFRGNFSSSEFNLFDNGDKSVKNKSKPRKHLAHLKKQQVTLFNNKSTKIQMIIPKPQESNSPLQGVRNYEPIEFICDQKNGTPIAKDLLNKKGLNIQQLRTEQSHNGQIKTITLYTGQQTESLIVRKKSETYFEMQIGCPLTIVQGMSYLLSLIESSCI